MRLILNVSLGGTVVLTYRRTRIDNDAIYAILLRLVDSINDRTLVIGLEGGEDSALPLRNLLHIVNDILQGFIPVYMRLAGTEEI